MSKGRIALVWFYVITAMIALVAFISPLQTSATEEDPTGGAGLSAPIIALCAAAIAFTDVFSPPSFRPIRRICIGIGSMGSAYLWIASEAKTHPADPTLPGMMLLLFVLAAFATVAVPVIALSDKSKSKDGSSEEDDDGR